MCADLPTPIPTVACRTIDYEHCGRDFTRLIGRLLEPQHLSQSHCHRLQIELTLGILNGAKLHEGEGKEVLCPGRTDKLLLQGPIRVKIHG